MFPEELCRQYFANYYAEGKLQTLLLAQMLSRHRSKKYYDAFVLIDEKGTGENSVISYCCECYVGLRVVGA